MVDQGALPILVRLLDRLGGAADGSGGGIRSGGATGGDELLRQVIWALGNIAADGREMQVGLRVEGFDGVLRGACKQASSVSVQVKF